MRKIPYNKDKIKENTVKREVKKMLNTIYTDKEYMAQGFTAQEVPMIREHDILFNQYQLGEVGEDALERIYELANILGLQG